MIFIVLGMHKSGTTLVARTLHQSGIYMGQDFPADADYSRSKFEAKWAQDINDSILGAERSVLSLNVTSRLLPKDPRNQKIQSMIIQGVSEMALTYNDWGFKDPRSSLTYGYWKRTLPQHRVIVLYRDPIEVWRRYARVNWRWYSKQAFEVWADYNKKIIADTSDIADSEILFIRFEDFLTGTTEFNRLAKFTGKQLNDVRDPSQSKFRVNGDKERSLKYRLLKKFAGDEVFRVYAELGRKHGT